MKLTSPAFSKSSTPYQIIYSQQINTANGNINESISLHNLSSGIYFVRINNVQQKLIIE
ncbi:MAG: T9SS type A sorting domain-containing protein [Bacteroidetes bacterium]|nr:T9SS type A sorting domain-containing protein [Bacteroidota bacterium]